MSKYIIGMTGASGSIYGVRLIEELLKMGNEVHIIITDSGRKVLEYETDYTVELLKSHLEQFKGDNKIQDIDDLFAATASGSFRTDGMVVLPCSMATLGEIANGVSKNLLGRSADVCLKERRKLIIVPRETPLNTIHLKNMVSLSEAGALILPAMPGFYHKPETIDDMINFIVGKVMDSLGIENDLFDKWGK
ncbi:MAG: UbiX family flavin prenyltransferase [Vallitaleaceae bacterium]|nr:UbiX family flavin prenyltransferase [Vallitaleaceae bacterium]